MSQKKHGHGALGMRDQSSSDDVESSYKEGEKLINYSQDDATKKSTKDLC